jgi:F-type H+-transporting ATPase subunit b
MKKLIVLFALLASPALAETEEAFFSLKNTEFIVLLAFLLFVAILVWQKVPAKIGALLDARATQIKADLDEAKALREEAKLLLDSYEKKQKEVLAQSERIVATAKDEAQSAAVQAKEDLNASIARRLAAAVEQISAAEASAIRQVRESAISVAVAATADVLSKQSTAATASSSIDAAIAQVEAKLH